MKILVLSVLSFTFLSACGTSKKKAAMEMPMAETLKVDSKNLGRKGIGIRKVSKYGITAKVYRAAYYLENAKTDLSNLHNDPQNQALFFRFVYKVRNDQMKDGWKEAYVKSCEVECSKKPGLKQFLGYLETMNVGETMTLKFHKSNVEVLVNSKTKGKIESKGFRTNLLAAFFGPKAGDKKLKSQLLGEKK